MGYIVRVNVEGDDQAVDAALEALARACGERANAVWVPRERAAGGVVAEVEMGTATRVDAIEQVRRVAVRHSVIRGGDLDLVPFAPPPKIGPG